MSIACHGNLLGRSFGSVLGKLLSVIGVIHVPVACTMHMLLLTCPQLAKRPQASQQQSQELSGMRLYWTLFKMTALFVLRVSMFATLRWKGQPLSCKSTFQLIIPAQNVLASMKPSPNGCWIGI
eukprot:1158362-Pelagomonas_calceolata.AAC.8